MDSTATFQAGIGEKARADARIVLAGISNSTTQIRTKEADYLAHKLAHALAGCVAGAAAGGQCRDGALERAATYGRTEGVQVRITVAAK